MTKIHFLDVKIIVLLMVFSLSSFVIKAQDNAARKLPESKVGQLLLNSNLSAEAPKAATNSEENSKTEENKTSSSSPRTENSANNSLPNYSQQQNSSATVDYLTEAEKNQKKLQKQTKNQNSQINSPLTEYPKPQDSQNPQWQNYGEPIGRQMDEQTDAINERLRKAEIERTTQQKEEEKSAAEHRKWLWLIPLFEILQVIGLGILSYKYKVARKSVMAMTASGVLFLLIYLNSISPFKIDLFIIGLTFGLIGIYAYVVGKLSAYVILSQIPKKLTAKLLSAFSIGISLIILYSYLDKKAGYGEIGTTFGVGVILIGGIMAIFKSFKTNDEDLHGSARFAGRKDFEELEKPVESGSFILAPAHPNGNHIKVVLPRHLSVMHGLILGGSGTGKSRGFFMANCAEVKDTSIVVTDPKSELWKYTSGFHKKPLRFAPTEPEASQCFNWIPLCTNARMSELCARAIMTAGSTQNTDQFWIDSETAFLGAIFAHAATMDFPTPLTAYNLFTRNSADDLLQILLNSPSSVAREQAIVFAQTDARIKGAIVPAVASRMQFMRDEAIKLFTSAQLDAPNFSQLRHMPIAVYWCLREQDIARLRPLTSLFFTILLEQLAGEEIPEGATRVPINMMLDEFANIGKIPDFETTISLARGRDVALWLGVQSLSQFNQTYGSHAAQTIISNCATKVALHGLDYQTAEYISKSLGEQTVSHSSRSFNIGVGGGSVGSHAAKHRRPLLTPDEVMRIGENEAISRTSNKYPMKLYKGYYNEKPNTYPLTQSLSKIQQETEENDKIIAI